MSSQYATLSIAIVLVYSMFPVAKLANYPIRAKKWANYFRFRHKKSLSTEYIERLNCGRYIINI